MLETSLDAQHAKEQEIQAGVPAWRREGRPRLPLLGPVYRSGYLNAFLVGRLEDGRDFALVAGSHSRHYPYAHPQSKWDDLLLAVANDTYLITGRQIAALALSLGPGDVARVSFHGRAFTSTASAVQLDFHFNLFARQYPARPVGLGVRRMVLGLLWQPALVIGTGNLTVHDRRASIPHVVGEMERGSLLNIRSRFFEFGYEYRAAVRPGAPAAYVEYQSYPLHPGLVSLPVRTVLRRERGRASLTLAGDTPEVGDRFHLKPTTGESTTSLLAHEVNLGPAIIRRELLRVGTLASVRYTFHEQIRLNA